MTKNFVDRLSFHSTPCFTTLMSKYATNVIGTLVCIKWTLHWKFALRGSRYPLLKQLYGESLRLSFTTLESFWLEIWLQYDSGVVNYDRRVFIRFAPGQRSNDASVINFRQIEVSQVDNSEAGLAINNELITTAGSQKQKLLLK